jgi:tetratricopeptide (TPR) repeat protein
MTRERDPHGELSAELFDEHGLERLLERAEREPAASAELDFLADIVAAAELERARLCLRPAPAVSPLRQPARRPTHAWLLTAAAALLLGLALGLWFLRGGDEGRERALAALVPPTYVAGELRGADEDLAAEFARAMEPYARAEWPAAVRALEELLARHPAHGPAHFYLAAASAALGDTARAEAEYERAATAPDARLADHARLRLALTWAARGEGERARRALQVLADGEGELAASARAWVEALAR